MIILTGNSLNERHRELNTKVNEAVKNGIPFDDIKFQSEETDVDRLFKIDLANINKNLEYIIDTLKCGDNLYITRALKCKWLYDDEFSHIINPDYLDEHIFPEMSLKMKRVLLKMIAQQVTNNDRAALFFTYCVKISLPFIALKFLLYTSEAFKLEVLKENSLYISDENKLNIIGNSFILASAVLDQFQNYKVYKYLQSLSPLYSVSENKYLDIVEKYGLISGWPSKYRLGLRISKQIIKNHKDRLFGQTSFYLSILNKNIIVKYSTQDDVKRYITNLIPALCSGFWSFYGKYEYLLEKIPCPERLNYIKDLYIKHYPDEKFEMNIEFYNNGLYKLMTKEERESWAFKHIEEGLEHFGHGEDFIWYKFVSFEKAFEPLKKYILVAASAEIRTSVIKVLTHSAQTDRDLQTLFNYYYQRFVNEMKRNKEVFVNDVLCIHNCYKFDENCWNAFDKILHSMDVYDTMNAYSCKPVYKIISIIYSILHERELHECLKSYIDNDGINIYEFKQQTDKLPEHQVEKVYQYIFNYYMKQINSFDIDNYNDEVRYGVRQIISNLFDLMSKYDKPKTDVPEIVTKFINLDIDEYKYTFLFTTQKKPFTQHILIKDLKKDAYLVLAQIPLLKIKMLDGRCTNFNTLLRKIKLYFSHDLGSKYVELYKELLALDKLYEKTSDAAVYGLLNLTNTNDKIDFVTKYIPTEPKIEHDMIERKLLYIRTAICKFMCVSRPVVPFSIVQKYIVGDYLKLCLPMFQSYAANLKPSMFIEFVKFLLKSPASIQKHGIRMAFQCFSIKDLKEVMSDLWKKTKNVSLRLVIYKAVHDKIVKAQDEASQKELFEAFKAFTLDIREDDDDKLFRVMTGTSLPSHILGDHILSTWQVLNTLPNKPIMIGRQSMMIRNMAKYIVLIEQDVVESIVCKHINDMLKEDGIKVQIIDERHELINTKWILTAKYLMFLPSKQTLEQKLNIVETLIKECVRLWDYADRNVYVVRLFLSTFIRDLEGSIFYEQTEYCLHSIILLKEVLKHLQEALPMEEIYNTVWSLRISVIVANIIADGTRTYNDRGGGSEILIFTESIDNFANEFVNLVNDFMEKNIYFASAISVMTPILTKYSDNLLHKWPFQAKDNGQSNIEYIFFKICSKLSNIEDLEAYKIAISLWPLSYKGQIFLDFKDKIKSSDNLEIKHLFYDKFVRENAYSTLN